MDHETLKHAETVRKMSGNGMSQRAIAQAVGLSVATINRILNTNDADISGSLAEMVAQEVQRRALREQIADAHEAGEDVSVLWTELRTI